MPIAIEARGLSKSFYAGSGQCIAATKVLASVDLVVHAGDAVGVVGGRGSGKSTLLLCLAGLLGPDAGVVRWFGDSSVAAAAGHVLYHAARTDLLRVGRADCAHVHLVDIPMIAGPSSDLDAWIQLRQLAGDAVIVAARYRSAFPVDIPVFALTRGRLRPAAEDRARVAEPAASRRG
jgi:ABC-type cobalamin/Fe3+-siderophores transport system ATPase subunit